MAQNQVLIVGSPKTRKLSIAKEIFHVNNLKDYMEEDMKSHSGIIIKGALVSTKYYEADVGLFIDEVPENTVKAYKRWFTEFRSNDMKELRDYIKGIVVTVDVVCLTDDVDSFIAEMELTADQLDEDFVNENKDSEKFQWEGFKVVVAVDKKASKTEPTRLAEIEDRIFASGFDFVLYDDPREGVQSDEEYGRRRLQTIVESNQWPVMVRKPIHEENSQKESIEDLDSVMRKILKAKNEALSIEDKEERKRYVNEAVSQIMKGL